MAPLTQIEARAVMPDDALIAAYLAEDPTEFWRMIAEREAGEQFDDCHDGDDELDDFDCGLDGDGQCANAGSEWCDFECPMRDTDAYAGNA